MTAHTQDTDPFHPRLYVPDIKGDIGGGRGCPRKSGKVGVPGGCLEGGATGIPSGLFTVPRKLIFSHKIRQTSKKTFFVSEPDFD